MNIANATPPLIGRGFLATALLFTAFQLEAAEDSSDVKGLGPLPPEVLALPVELRGEVVLVSCDPARDTPAALHLHQYREERLLDEQWTLLHGSNDAVREPAVLLGVKYKQESDGQFAHTNLISILNAEGEIVHHRTGLRGGLAEAAAALAATAHKP